MAIPSALSYILNIHGITLVGSEFVMEVVVDRVFQKHPKDSISVKVNARQPHGVVVPGQAGERERESVVGSFTLAKKRPKAKEHGHG